MQRYERDEVINIRPLDQHVADCIWPVSESTFIIAIRHLGQGPEGLEKP